MFRTSIEKNPVLRVRPAGARVLSVLRGAKKNILSYSISFNTPIVFNEEKSFT